MPNAFGQVWSVYRYADSEIVLTEIGSADPSGWTLSFLIGPDPFPTNPGTTIPTAVLTITPTVSGTTIRVPITRAQIKTTLPKASYEAALWRTDAGSEKPLATGEIPITTVPTPQ